MDLLQNFFPCISGGTLEGGIQQLLQQLVNGIAKGSIYALVALGYTMVYGIVELINFAHGDIFMLGSFIALTSNLMGVTGLVKGEFYVLIGVLLVAFLATMLHHRHDRRHGRADRLQPLRNAPKLAPLISAIGMSFILQNIGQIWRGAVAGRLPRRLQDTSSADRSWNVRDRASKICSCIVSAFS